MKRVRNIYWVLALIGFIFPVSRVVLVQIKPLTSAVYLQIFASVLNYPPNQKLTGMMIFIMLVALISLCVHLFYLTAWSIEATAKNRRNFVIATLIYCLFGGALLYFVYANEQGMFFVAVIYYLFLAGSTILIRNQE